MADAVIGALRVNLSADTAQFSRGLTTAEMRMKRFATITKASAAIIGAALGTMAIVIGVAVKRTIDHADALNKLSQRVGFSVEQLSKWKYAADLAGTSLEEMSVSLRRMASNMDDAARGTGTAKLAFDRLGITVTNTDGTLRATEDVMLEVADRFSKMADGATKSALAMDIFGRSGVSMIPLLNEGAQGLREMFTEAERFGIVIDTQTARAAEDFNDNLTRLSAIWDGLIIKITAALVGPLKDLSEMLLSIADAIDFVRMRWQQWQEVLGISTEAMPDFNRSIDELTKGWMRETEANYSASRAVATYRQELEKVGPTLEEIQRQQLLAATKVAQDWLGVADTLGGALNTMFQDNKAVAIAQAVINTAQAITKTMAEYGFTPVGVAAMAAAAAAGAAQIAAITRTQPGGGSAPRSSSGGKAPKDGGGGTQRTEKIVNVNLTGGPMFGQDQVRGLIDEINKAVGDGATIRVR